MAPRSKDAREGRVEVSRFVSTDAAAAALGQGPVSVESESGDGSWVEAGMRRTYEAAIVDALVGVGYDTLHAGQPQPQVARLRISRQVLSPQRRSAARSAAPRPWKWALTASPTASVSMST
uniref:hypothetical protein n=1 Tax=Paenibacillus abyssi TaxID=1340531 RepID=UPI0036706651